MDVCAEIIVPIYGFKFEINLVDDIWEYYVKNNISGERKAIEQYKAVVIDFPDRDKQYTHYVVFRDDGYDISCIAHEAFHLTYSILTQVGVKLTKESEEAFAYLISYLTNEIAERLLHLKIVKCDMEERANDIMNYDFPKIEKPIVLIQSEDTFTNLYK